MTGNGGFDKKTETAIFLVLSLNPKPYRDLGLQGVDPQRYVE